MIIHSLKASWCNYKAKVSLVVTEEADILQWRYDCWLEHNGCLAEESADVKLACTVSVQKTAAVAALRMS
jgi:hypothetical protein